MEVNYQKILDKAKQLTKNGIDWHHHYLPPNCLLNNSSKHIVVLESGNLKWQTSFDAKPMQKLEELENIFFRRKLL